MSRFEFATATRIVFGPGTLPEAAPAARALGRHALLVAGRDPTRTAPLHEALVAAGLAVTRIAVTGEPTTEALAAAVAAARAAGGDVVVGCGGGAVLDTAKALAGLVPAPGEVLDYLEVVGRGLALPPGALPCIAIPTTAGTGSEVTRNAVLAAPVPGAAHRVKASLRSPHLLPRLALVDPLLTHDLPPALTAATGLDAFTQLLEPYVCTRANPLTDALCLEGLRRAARSLRRAVDDGRDAAARADLALAGLHGGLALANAGLGAVHGFAAPLGGMFPAPHGAVCAALLAPVTAANLRALRIRMPDSPALARYAEVARLVTGSPHADADALVPWLESLVAHCAIPRLSAYGVTAAHIPAVAAAAAQASSMKANPVVLTPEELAAILHCAL